MPPSLQKPLLVFDGECQFCRHWIERWRTITLDRVDYQPLQEAAADFPDISRESFEREVKLIDPDGRVFGGAEAVFRSLNHAARPVGSPCWRGGCTASCPASRPSPNGDTAGWPNTVRSLQPSPAGCGAMPPLARSNALRRRGFCKF